MTNKALRRLLEAHELTQRAMAEKLGIDERTMRRYCSDATIPKSVEIAIKCLLFHQGKEIRE